MSSTLYEAFDRMGRGYRLRIPAAGDCELRDLDHYHDAGTVPVPRDIAKTISSCEKFTLQVPRVQKSGRPKALPRGAALGAVTFWAKPMPAAPADGSAWYCLGF